MIVIAVVAITLGTNWTRDLYVDVGIIAFAYQDLHRHQQSRILIAVIMIIWCAETDDHFCVLHG